MNLIAFSLVRFLNPIDVNNISLIILVLLSHLAYDVCSAFIF